MLICAGDVLGLNCCKVRVDEEEEGKGEMVNGLIERQYISEGSAFSPVEMPRNEYDFFVSALCPLDACGHPLAYALDPCNAMQISFASTPPDGGEIAVLRT